MKKQIHGISNLCSALLLSTAVLCLTACDRQTRQPAPHEEKPFTETISSGPIELTVFAEPAQVHLDRDILLTMRVCAPSNFLVSMPAIKDRLKGFMLNGSYTREQSNKSGKPVKDYCYRLMPTMAEEYRIGPMAICWTNSSTAAAGSSPEVPIAQSIGTKGGWFATRPIVFQAAGIAAGPPGATIHEIAPPVWIYPPFRTVALWILSIAGIAGAFYLLYWLSRRIHRSIILRRMSPRERALYELNELMERDLIGKARIKEFYLELTMIVRRYIERAHAIRAPEQTTEEFLGTAAQNPEFNRDVVIKLRKFLQTADLVKFAAYRPEQDIIDQTFATARDYIETDEKSK